MSNSTKQTKARRRLAQLDFANNRSWELPSTIEGRIGKPQQQATQAQWKYTFLWWLKSGFDSEYAIYKADAMQDRIGYYNLDVNNNPII